MKTRIISGAVLIALLIILVVAQFYWPVLLCIAAAFLSAAAVYEVLHCTGLTAYKPLVFWGMFGSFVMPFVLCGYLPFLMTETVAVFFFLLAFAIALKGHEKISIAGFTAALVFPFIFSFSFAYLVQILQHSSIGLFGLLLVLCASVMADTGAYFTGVCCGKHKMAPVISPKKTWEGFVGGLVCSCLSAFIVCLIYSRVLNYNVNFAAALCGMPVFTVLGVLGDLTASMLKRKCGIKDYGHLIPGHGGILDRFDSILMIVPAFYMYISYVQLIK